MSTVWSVLTEDTCTSIAITSSAASPVHHSLGFQLAHDIAASGGTALIIGRKISNIPCHVTLSPETTSNPTSFNVEHYKHIHYKYVSSIGEFITVCSALHNYSINPNIIVVQDLSALTSSETMQDDIIKCLGYLEDVLMYLKSTTWVICDVESSISDLYRRRSMCSCCIEEVGYGEYGMTVHNSSSSGIDCRSKKQYQYQLTLRGDVIKMHRI